MEHSAGQSPHARVRACSRQARKRKCANVSALRHKLIWGNGGGVREMQMRTRPRGGGGWGGIRAGFFFWGKLVREILKKQNQKTIV